ncbi:unnamed protein product, partial [Prorocentrum cordatum]
MPLLGHPVAREAKVQDESRIKAEAKPKGTKQDPVVVEEEASDAVKRDKIIVDITELEDVTKRIKDDTLRKPIDDRIAELRAERKKL